MRLLTTLASYVLVTFSTELLAGAFSDYESESRRLTSSAELSGLTARMLDQAGEELGKLSAVDCKAMVDVLGVAVEKQNSSKIERQSSIEFRQVGLQIAELCRKRVRNLESSIGDDEAALEKFYRSESWFTFNYVFSAVRYWQAWIDFGLSQSSDAKSERIEALAAAERGFQIAAMRIHYPGIVFGSWWGLANVALQREDNELAEQRLGLLQQAIVNTDQSELRKLVDRELRLLTIRQGDGRHLVLEDGPLDQDQAELLIEEAFVLLEEQRRRQSGGIDAASRLKQVLAAGFYDDALVARVMTYQEEIAGRDIGVLGLLVEAEYAFAYQKYNTVVLKTREFRRQGGESLALDNKLYDYHYAVSLYQTDLLIEALREIKELLDGSVKEPDLLAASSKLYFSVAGRLYDGNSNDRNEKEYVASARRLIENTVKQDDPYLGLAWSVLAKFEDDKQVSDQYFEHASLITDSDDSVTFARFQKLAVQFERAYLEGDLELQGSLAAEARVLFQKLDRKVRKEPIVKALDLQFSSVIRHDVKKTLGHIDKLWEENAQNATLLRILFRAALILHDRSELPEELNSYVADVVASSPDDWMLDEMFDLLLIRERSGNWSEVVDLTATLAPAFNEQPINHRYLLLLQIRALAFAGDADTAFNLADEMVHQYPDSGDAWKIFAIVAEQRGNHSEADRAWAKLSRSSPKGSPLWLESVQKQIALKSHGEAGKACLLLASATPYTHLMDDEGKARFKNWMNNLDCQNRPERST